VQGFDQEQSTKFRLIQPQGIRLRCQFSRESDPMLPIRFELQVFQKVVRVV
jgi:hypothetical protein